jgi:hypothetical protein
MKRELSFALIMIAAPWPVSANASSMASNPSSLPPWLKLRVSPLPRTPTPSP